MDVVEADEVVQEAVDALTDLSHDALPVIAWTLGNILDTLSKVNISLSPDTLSLLMTI